MAESKFVKRLREIATGSLPSIGFKKTAEAPPPALLLTVVLPSLDAEHAAAAIDGGAEALILRVSMQDELAREAARLRKVVAAAGPVPCGVIPVGALGNELERAQQLQSLGFDFVVVTAHDSSEILRLEDMGKVMIIDRSFDNDLIKTLNELNVDAAEVSLARPEDLGRQLTIRDIMHYKLMKMLVRKPIIVRGDRTIQPQDIVDLCDAGVEGLVIDATVTGSEPQAIKETTRAYQDLIISYRPPVRKRNARHTPLVPSLKPSAPMQEAEPEEY